MPGDTDRIRKQAVLDAPLERAWRAIGDPQRFGTWFGVELDGPFVPGTRVTGRIVPTQVDPAVALEQEPYTGMPCDLEIERVEPPRLLSFRWHPGAPGPDVDTSAEPTTLVEFTLAEAAGGGTVLTITESGFDRLPPDRRAEAYASNEGGWEAQLGLVAKYLAQA